MITLLLAFCKRRLYNLCMKIRTIFIGTSEFAVPILDELLKQNFIDLVAVITQPDRPIGRKQELNQSPVKEYVINNHPELKVLQPEKIKNSYSDIVNFAVELIIVASYGQIIPKQILGYPKYGVLNVHGSILPELRGAVPIQMAILNGFKETGVTLQKMVFELDAGEVVAVRETTISSIETSASLTRKLSELSRYLIREDLEQYLIGNIILVQQDSSKATYCSKNDILKEKAEIRFDTDINLAERMIRAFYPWPVAWVRLVNGKVLKIFKASIHENVRHSKSTNQLLTLKKIDKQLILELHNGELVLEEVQLEGKKRDIGKNYLWLTDSLM